MNWFYHSLTKVASVSGDAVNVKMMQKKKKRPRVKSHSVQTLHHVPSFPELLSSVQRKLCIMAARVWFTPHSCCWSTSSLSSAPPSRAPSKNCFPEKIGRLPVGAGLQTCRHVPLGRPRSPLTDASYVNRRLSDRLLTGPTLPCSAGHPVETIHPSLWRWKNWERAEPGAAVRLRTEVEETEEILSVLYSLFESFLLQRDIYSTYNTILRYFTRVFPFPATSVGTSDFKDWDLKWKTEVHKLV